MPAVRVDKDCFRFQGHGHGIASSDTLRIYNVSTFPVTYKVKTTNTKHYAVRPNLDVIESGSCTDVTIVHNSRLQIPVGPATDKFLLEVASVPDAPEGSPAFSATHFWDARKKALQEGSRRDKDVAAAAITVDAYHFRVEFTDSSDTYADRNDGRAAEDSDKSTALSTQSSWTAHVRATRNPSRTRTRNRSCAPKSKRPSSIGARTAKSRHTRRSQQIEVLDPEVDESPASNRSTGSTPTPGAAYSQDDPVLEGASRRRSSGKKSGIAPPQTTPAESPKDTDSPPHESGVESPHDEDKESAPPAQAIIELGSGKKEPGEEDVLDLPVESAKEMGDNVTVHKLGPGVTVEEAAEAIKQMDKEGGDSKYIIISQPKEDSESKESEKESDEKESDKVESEKKESEKVSDKKESEKVESEKKESDKKDGSDKEDSPPIVTVIVKKESTDSGSSTRSGKATPDGSGNDNDKENTVTSVGTGSLPKSDESNGSKQTVEKTGSSKSTSEKRSESKRTGSDTFEDESKEKKEEGGGPSSDKSDEVEENLRKVAQALAMSSGNDDDKHMSSSSSSSDDEASKRAAIVTAVKEMFKSSSSSSSSETLHNGELAPTPPNERPTPAEIVNSRFGTEPSERSVSDLLDGSQGKSAMTGTVMTGQVNSEDCTSNHFYSNNGDSMSYGDMSGTLSTAPSGRHSDNRTYMNDSRSDSSFMRVGRRDFDDQLRHRRRGPPGPPGPWPFAGNPYNESERRFLGLPPRPSAFDRERRDIRDDFPNGDYRPAPSTLVKTYSDVQFADATRPPFYPPVVRAPTVRELQEHHERYGRAMDTPYNPRRHFGDDELTMFQGPRPHRRRRRKKKAQPPPPPPPPPPEEKDSSSSSSDDVPVVRFKPKKVADRRPTPMPSPSNSPPDESTTIIATVPGAKTNKEAKETVEKALQKIKVSMGGESDAGSDVSVVGSDGGDTRAKAVLNASGKKITLMPVSPLHSDGEEQNKIEQLRKLNARLEKATANLDRVREELALVALGEVVQKPKKRSRRKSRLNPEDLDD